MSEIAEISNGKPLEERIDKYELNEEEDLVGGYDDHDVSRPFPILPGEEEETHQLTFRAVFVGCCLGAVVGASNIYLGLKTGFTFGPQLFGAIFGFAILKPLARVLPETGLIGRTLGGSFGPKENCTVQSSATAAGGLGILFVSAIPAMYRLGLLSDDPTKDIGKLIALTTCAGFFGVFFVIPLRKYYIVHQKLTFPTPAATAYTIRSLHVGKAGAAIAKKKSLALLGSFAATFSFKVASGYLPGLMYQWHVGWIFYRLGWDRMIQFENYGWIIELTPAFFGAGMLSGLNASWSFLAGSVLAWGIIAPELVKRGLASGVSISDDFPLVSYQSLSFKDPDRYITDPSPRYWLLWPGVMIMLLYSFADVFLSLVPIVGAMYAKGDLNPIGWFRTPTDIHPDDEDQTPLADRIPTSWWTLGLLASTIMCCAILATQFSMNVGEAILSLLLGFIFSFIGVQSTGTTDVNPVSTVAKASQLVFGGVSHGMAQNPARMLNLSAGVIAAGSAAQAADMTGDLKTGYLLRAKPRNQFIAQLCGAVVAVFLTSGLFILFTKAAPCIINPPASGECTYSAPSVSAWAAVAVAVTSPKLPIPKSSGYTAIVLSLISVLTLLVRNYLIPKKYWHWIPNWNAIGLGFVVPQTYYSIAMGVGSIFNWIWLKHSPGTYDMYMFSISAGLLAGEGLGGVAQALLAILNVDGSRYGSTIGCPAFDYENC
ncbi:oligopeptide transporter, partial [Pluteus cervinus]